MIDLLRILLTGLPGAGKSTAAAILQEHHGFRVVNIGDALRDHLRHRGVQVHRRLEIGPAFLARFPASAVFEAATQATPVGGPTAYDGVRLALTCAQFRTLDRDTRIWVLEADATIRAARLGTMATPASQGTTYQDYEDQQLIISAMADEVLVNNGALADLREGVRARLVRATGQA